MRTKVFVLVFSLLMLTTLFGKQPVLTVDPQNEPFDPDSGGPDDYGYIWIDSNDPGGPTYNWIDTSAVWTKVYGLGDENNVGPFPIGFDFPYYWYKVDSFWVNSNGAISFSDSEMYIPMSLPSGFIIPNTMRPNDLVIPLGSDISFESDPDSGSVYYYTNNVDTLIVSYLDVPAWSYGGLIGSHTFQLILTRSDSYIYFQYGKQEGNFHEDADCVGIENVSGEIGLQVLYNEMPDSGYAVKFMPPFIGVEEEEDKMLSYSLTLMPVSPNPVRGNTQIHYLLPSEADVTLKIYNILGQEVRTLVDTHQKSGLHSVSFDTKDSRGNALPQGIYFYRLNVGNNSLTRKITLIR